MLYFYVQPFYLKSFTFILFYVWVFLRWDPFYVKPFYIQSSTSGLSKLHRAISVVTAVVNLQVLIGLVTNDAAFKAVLHGLVYLIKFSP